ncbi:hypothetical protein LOZ58_001996 [Ophidiomyces ophidiicola]|nr:hypothetical protein LOZ65_003450 [Ophidiomyces ophidiicola]KAI1964134.1 hypothetical protein LOZ58_001996 [Ophidiomyces ophidiicola]
MVAVIIILLDKKYAAIPVEIYLSSGAPGGSSPLSVLGEQTNLERSSPTPTKPKSSPAAEPPLSSNASSEGTYEEITRSNGMEPNDLDTLTSTAADTISLLETRLRRVEYLLTGRTSWSGEPERVSAPPAAAAETVAARLAGLERELKVLSAQAPAVQDVLKLYARYPDLFQTSDPTTVPSTLSTPSLASIVLSYAAAFPETASRLSSLQDLPVPPASASTGLIELRPRINRLLKEQEVQADEVAELRVRSALLMQRWIEVGIVGGGELWGEWEDRVTRAERAVRRLERQREDAQ